MVTRFISATTSEIMGMSREELRQSLKASEGRIIVSENVAPRETFVGDITSAEIAKAYGADLILLNNVDVMQPEIFGLAAEQQADFVKHLKHLVGRPIGINLEPVDPNGKAAATLTETPIGRQAHEETIKIVEDQQFSFVCFTGNPGSGVTNAAILESVKVAKKHFTGLIFAGKMHGSGIDEPVVTDESVKALVEAGADVILVPSVGTIPGFDEDQLKRAVKAAHAAGAMVMTAIGTSQESSSPAVIEQMGITNKICGADMQHIGDAGFGGLAPVENLFALSTAIRGLRHAVGTMARSINR